MRLAAVITIVIKWIPVVAARGSTLMTSSRIEARLLRAYPLLVKKCAPDAVARTTATGMQV